MHPTLCLNGSRCYDEWQTLAYEAETRAIQELLGPHMKYLEHTTPTNVLSCLDEMPFAKPIKPLCFSFSVAQVEFSGGGTNNKHHENLADGIT